MCGWGPVSVMVCAVMTVCLYCLVPREWMDALGPAVTSPSQQKRSSNAWASQENRITGTVTFIFLFIYSFVFWGFFCSASAKFRRAPTAMRCFGVGSRDARPPASTLRKMLSSQQRLLSAGVGLACETVSN